MRDMRLVRDFDDAITVSNSHEDDRIKGVLGGPKAADWAVEWVNTIGKPLAVLAFIVLLFAWITDQIQQRR